MLCSRKSDGGCGPGASPHSGVGEYATGARLLQQDAAGRGISVRVLSREGIAGNYDIAIC
jgi:hypothetical protein